MFPSTGVGRSREIPKRTLVCGQCRLKKVKCDRAVPCRRCVVAGHQCVYPLSKRGQRFPKISNDASPDLKTGSMAEGMGRDNNHQIGRDDQRSQGVFQHDVSKDLILGRGTQKVDALQPTAPETSSLCQPHDCLPTKYQALLDISAKLREYQPPKVAPNNFLTTATDSSKIDYPPLNDAAGTVISPQLPITTDLGQRSKSLAGPLSWLSICSEPGIAWVSQRTGSTEFAKTASDLVSGWTRRLKVDRHLLRGCFPEPERETAWNYTKTYFETSFDATFGVVEREEFERSLRLHHNGDQNLAQDPAWQALRNVVFASGCRLALERTKSPREVQAESWSYFQNALAVLPELLFTFTGIMAIRALTAMCFFAEGLFNPSLQYMLCGSAVRLAHSKGLHHQPARAWSIKENEVLSANWLFWVIYVFEKNLSVRSARPSIIDDREISCQIPTKANVGSTIQVETFTNAIRHAQIASRISSSLMSIDALRQPPSTLLETATELEKELNAWKDTLPDAVRPRDAVQSPYAVDGYQAPSILFQYTYHGAFLAIYPVFMNPWFWPALGRFETILGSDKMLETAQKVANAARNILILTTKLEITSGLPSWVYLGYPLIAVVNLFTYILKFPELASVRCDIALLDMTAGHFARLEFQTEKSMNLVFARELASQARQFVDKSSIGRDDVGRNAGTHAANEVATADMAEFWTDDRFAFDDEVDLDVWEIYSSIFTDGYTAL